MTKHLKIYVALINEGIEVWRPVDAESIAPEMFKIVSNVPDDEVWEFQQGDVVTCRSQEFSDGIHLVADKKAVV